MAIGLPHLDRAGRSLAWSKISRRPPGIHPSMARNRATANPTFAAYVQSIVEIPGGRVIFLRSEATPISVHEDRCLRRLLYSTLRKNHFRRRIARIKFTETVINPCFIPVAGGKHGFSSFPPPRPSLIGSALPIARVPW